MNRSTLGAACSAALARAALLAALTLYLVNIYPAMAQGDGDPGQEINIDALFDFEVPIGVVSTGVVEALTYVPDSPDWASPTNDIAQLDTYFDSIQTNVTERFVFGTNGIGYADPVSAVANTYSEAVVELASSAPQGIVGVGQSSPVVGTFNTVTLNALPSALLASDSPSPVQLGALNPFGGAQPGSSFWVDTLTVNACKAIDGGRLAAAVQTIDPDGFLGWLQRGYEPALQTWCNFVNQSWLSSIVRGASKIVCVLLFWFFAYRYVISKLFLIIDAALNTVRTAKMGG